MQLHRRAHSPPSPSQTPILFILIALFFLPLTSAKAAFTITVPPPIPSNVPSFKSTRLFTSAILNSTNVYRHAHNASSLRWNSTLARFASDYLAAVDCVFKHSGGPYGENLALGHANATAAVEAWGNERDKYRFWRPGFSLKTGHFTQLVWKSTTDVGCGRRLCGRRGWYTACEYWPQGNIEGFYTKEVQRKVNAAGWVRPWSLWGFAVLLVAFVLIGT